MYEQIDLFQFIILNSDFYIPIDHIECGENYKQIVKSHLKPGWHLEDQGIWTFVFNEANEFPDQGWKIHISAIPQNAREILQKTVPILVSNKVNFKFACNEFVLTLLNSKNWSRGGSGKFITIYPPERLFKPLIQELYNELHSYVGPYILSDMRYRDAKVIYYRYGGFQPMEKLTVEGYKISLIKTPEGEFIQDNRPPFYNPPPWVKDPFGQEPRYEENILLNNRYKVLFPISFSNSGGVYKAVDTFNNQEVIIKEARPFVNLQENISAKDLLEKEFEILKRIEDLGIAPKPISYFKEWEHFFLVEEFIKGMDLREYVVVNSPILKTNPEFEDYKNYFRSYRKIFLNLIDSIEKLHSRGIIFRDLSHNNIIIQDDLSVKLIDFESAYLMGSDRWIQIFTPGFASPSQILNEMPRFSDDIYSIGENLMSAIFPINQFFSLAPDARDRYLKDIIVDMNFPTKLKKIISISTSGGDRVDLRFLKTSLRKLRFPKPFKRQTSVLTDAEINRMIKGIRKYLFNSNKWERELGTPFPLYAEAYLTNIYSVAYGVSGILLSMLKCGFSPHKKQLEWFANQDFDDRDIPPGLYMGLSGIAWTLLKLGHEELGIKVFDKALSHPLVSDSVDMFYGMAGIGITSLQFYRKLGEDIYLSHAVQLSETISNKLEEADNLLHFKGTDGDVHYGYAHGTSGVALFMLYLYLATKDERFLNLSQRLMDFDLSHAVDYKDAISWHPSKEHSSTVMPYVKYGTSGIISVLLRINQITPFKQEYIHKGLRDITRKYAIFPGQLNGLSGMGETIIDAMSFKGDLDNHLQRLIKGVSLFMIKRPEGITFPSEGLFRISCDYGTGCSGIMSFLCRTINRDKRLLFDLE